jgi:hypothetical protein
MVGRYCGDAWHLHCLPSLSAAMQLCPRHSSSIHEFGLGWRMNAATGHAEIRYCAKDGDNIPPEAAFRLHDADAEGIDEHAAAKRAHASAEVDCKRARRNETKQGARPVPPSAPAPCTVCLDAAAVMAVIPCGHQCLCLTCSGLVRADSDNPLCPVCRGPLRDVLHVYTV